MNMRVGSHESRLLLAVKVNIVTHTLNLHAQPTLSSWHTNQPAIPLSLRRIWWNEPHSMKEYLGWLLPSSYVKDKLSLSHRES